MTARKFMRERSALQLGPVAKLLERFRVRQRLDVLYRLAMDNVAHCELHDLAALGARDVGDLDDLGWNVPRCRCDSDVLLDLVDQRRVEHETVTKTHEQDDANIADFTGWPGLADHERLDDFL